MVIMICWHYSENSVHRGSIDVAWRGPPRVVGSCLSPGRNHQRDDEEMCVFEQEPRAE